MVEPYFPVKIKEGKIDNIERIGSLHCIEETVGIRRQEKIIEADFIAGAFGNVFAWNNYAKIDENRGLIASTTEYPGQLIIKIPPSRIAYFTLFTTVNRHTETVDYVKAYLIASNDYVHEFTFSYDLDKDKTIIRWVPRNLFATAEDIFEVEVEPDKPVAILMHSIYKEHYVKHIVEYEVAEQIAGNFPVLTTDKSYINEIIIEVEPITNQKGGVTKVRFEYDHWWP